VVSFSGASRLSLLCALAFLPVSGIPQASFRAGTDVVPVYATVRSADGHLVTDLQASDFELLDRGTRVPLSVFSNDVQPITVAVLVDMSGGLFDATRYAALRAALMALVDQLGPADRARFGTFYAGEVALSFRLTSDHAELERVLREELWAHGGNRPLWNAVASAMTSLSGESGRRVILVLTNGPNTASIPGLPGGREVEAAEKSGDFMFYGVTLFPKNLYGQAHLDWRAPTAGADDTYPRLSLQELTDQTGGGLMEAIPGDNYMRGMSSQRWDELVTALSSVVEELRHQYALGFVPVHRDGRVGTIDVRVRRPGAKVTARKNYRAPAA
jgi:VWFA-related protein